jgi:hypothetical protein
MHRRNSHTLNALGQSFVAKLGGDFIHHACLSQVSHEPKGVYLPGSSRSSSIPENLLRLTSSKAKNM